MVPNILITPLGDKVTGTAFYHKTLQPKYKATSTFIFGKNNGRSHGAQHPPWGSVG
jgi:hypothetical protein